MNTTTQQRPFVWREAVAALLLLAPALFAWQPTFGGVAGYVAPAAGVLVGVAVMTLGLRFAWPWWRTALALVTAYFLLGGAVALPATTIAGVVPSLDTLYRLVVLTAQSWRDLLTVSVPAGDFTGPAVVPWLSGLAVAAVTVLLATRAEQVLWTLLPPLSWLTTAIVMGGRDVPNAWWLGAAFGVEAIGWLVWRRLSTEARVNAQILVNATTQRSAVVRRLIAAAATIGVAAAASLTLVALTPGFVDRQVLRERIAPPLDLTQYASPLMGYRHLEVDLKKETLFTVTGLPAGQRLVLARMTTFDGDTYTVDQDAASYLRIGTRIGGQDRAGTPVELRIEPDRYSGAFLPSTGTPLGFRFDSKDSFRQADGLYFNRDTSDTLTTASLGKGTTLTVDALVSPEPTPEQRKGLVGKPAGQATVPIPERVPDVIGTRALDLIEGAGGSPYEQLTAIESKLRTEGYYSDGSNSRSLSGHTSWRLGTFLAAPSMIGDDEQYATTMALMALRLGIPARVVMGFYPAAETPAGQPWAVKGTEAHVWVEANIDGAGWVSFDPTPDRNRVPKQEAPKPSPKPKPQVEPPQDPPAQPPKEPVTEDLASVKEDGTFVIPGWVYTVLAGLGVTALVAAPFVLVVALKARRTRRRHGSSDTTRRIAGGWNEVVDQAIDLGTPVARTATRAELAHQFTQRFPRADFLTLAASVDAADYGPQARPDAEADSVWEQARATTGAMVAAQPLHRRLLARVSPRSLLAGTGPHALAPLRHRLGSAREAILAAGSRLPLPRRRATQAGTKPTTRSSS